MLWEKNSSSQNVWLQNKALHITTDVIYHLFIFLITPGTKEEWQRPTQICNLSFTETCQTSQSPWSHCIFLTWHRLSLAGKGGPLKAIESLRWEEALPAEGSAMSKCQCCRAVINRQWWQPVVLLPARCLPHDKTLQSGGVRQRSCLHYFHFMKGGQRFVRACGWRCPRIGL